MLMRLAFKAYTPFQTLTVIPGFESAMLGCWIEILPLTIVTHYQNY